MQRSMRYNDLQIQIHHKQFQHCFNLLCCFHTSQREIILFSTNVILYTDKKHNLNTPSEHGMVSKGIDHYATVNAL